MAKAKTKPARKVRPALVQARQAALLEAAEDAITDLFSHTAVTKEQTRTALYVLIDSIQAKIKTIS